MFDNRKYLLWQKAQIKLKDKRNGGNVAYNHKKLVS